MPAERRQRRDDDGAEEQEAPLSLLDAFDFNETRIPVLAGAQDDSRADAAAPLMLGDYSEKEHFPPSSSVLRNEVLEGVVVGAAADGGEAGAATGSQADIVGFQCIYCKDARAQERARCSVIVPRNIMSLLDCFVEFHQHVLECSYIPRDTKECYIDFKKQEEQHQPLAMIADDTFLWVSSAIRRGFRDRKGGGIIYCPELSTSELVEEQFIEHSEYFEHEDLHLLTDSRVALSEHFEYSTCDELMTMSKAESIPAKETFL